MRAFALPTYNPVASAARRAPAAAVTTRLLNHVLLWVEVRRQRRQLQSLSDAMLRDIGLSRADAERESTRSFWDVPWDAR